MTEKDYSGIATSKIGKNVKIRNNFTQSSEIIKSKEKTREAKKIELPASLIENYKKAGEIAKQVKQYAKEIIKLNMPLHEIAEKIEAKILELGGEIAFPVNLSIDDVAAHYTPTLHDEKLATGLLKVDLGVHINGCICEVSWSIASYIILCFRESCAIPRKSVLSTGCLVASASFFKSSAYFFSS